VSWGARPRALSRACPNALVGRHYGARFN
jgi:hypothetical protein